MDCKDCKHKNKVSKESGNAAVPYIAHEAAMARAERQHKRMWIACIVLAVIVFASNALWLWAWQSYDYTSETEEVVYTCQQDGSGVNVVGNGNEVQDGAESNDR